MNPVALIGLFAFLFLVTHMGVSSNAVRPWLLARIGEQAYRAIYSIISLATFVPLAVAFGYNKHAGTMLWSLRGVGPVRWLVWLMMLGAIVLFVAGLMNPSPASMTASGVSSNPGNARGVLKLTRHPGFVALGVFGVAHMLMNGWAGDLIFFGSFPVLSILGGIHQDRRKLGELGDSYRRLIDSTSFIPGLALIQGRQRWERDDTPWIAIVIGIVVTVVIVAVHPALFGGRPLG